MKAGSLIPKPTHHEVFQLNRSKYVPGQSGCYALTNFDGDILYIGSSVNLRQRMEQHLEDKEKTEFTKCGRATFFYWLDDLEFPEQVELAWVHHHESVEGKKPVGNKIYPALPSIPR